MDAEVAGEPMRWTERVQVMRSEALVYHHYRKGDSLL
jgi:hypothetical protein